jgi:hypothetical protein
VIAIASDFRNVFLSLLAVSYIAVIVSAEQVSPSKFHKVLYAYYCVTLRARAVM